MKKYQALALALAGLVAACRQPAPQSDTLSPLPIHQMQGRSVFEIKACDTIPLLNSVYLDVENQFTLAWPSLDGFDPSVSRELIKMAFDDTTSSNLQEAGRRFLARTWVEDDDLFDQSPASRPRRLDSVRIFPHNYATVTGSVRYDGNLLHFSVNDEHAVAYAAHGTYGYRSLTVDRTTGRAVRLADLMDTANLGKLLLRALDEVPSNRENGNTAECIDGEYQHRLPPPDGFTIDSNRTAITAFYNIYSVQCYGCGMLFVEMPVSWIAANTTLTPYGKSILKTD